MAKDDSEDRIPTIAWQKIAADIERLALQNDDLKRTVDELHRTCLAAFNENERMKKLLRDHNIKFEDASG